jgi:hypothetical protein
MILAHLHGAQIEVGEGPTPPPREEPMQQRTAGAKTGRSGVNFPRALEASLAPIEPRRQQLFLLGREVANAPLADAVPSMSTCRPEWSVRV